MGGSGSGKPKGELLYLDGREVVDGKIQKTDFFKFLGMDLTDYSDIELTPEEALKFKNHVVRTTYGLSAAIPLICSGERCMNKICPFHVSKKYPLARPCLLETRMVQYLTKSYMEDLEVSPESLTEMIQVNMLVELDILDHRANLGLSGSHDGEAPTLLKTTMVPHGEELVEAVNVHPLLEVKEKTYRHRTKLLESLAATRRERYKRAAALKQADDTDASKILADLVEAFPPQEASKLATSLDKIRKDAEEVAASSIEDADWEVK
jgi:hypothetical protein